MSGVSKFTADRNQRILLDLLTKPGNDVCADCKARTPRWASHNLGIFLCMNCASIHRKIGTHITKVKSVTMDSWSREQVEVMKSIGNLASNVKYNPNEARHPPPANREESERDSELEKFIRWKYEFKRFMNKSGTKDAPSVKTPLVRPQSTPAVTIARRSSPLPPLPTVPPHPSRVHSATTSPPAPPLRQPPAPSLPPSSVVQLAPAPLPLPQPTRNPAPHHPVWDDMMSLSNPGQSMPSTLPRLQLQAPGQFQQFTSLGNSAHTLGTTSTNLFPSTATSQAPGRSASLPVLAVPNNPFPTPIMGDPYVQQSTAYPGQVRMGPPSFQSSPSAPVQVQSPFHQLSLSPFSQSYTPPSTFPQQQQQQQFAPTSFPQQFVQASPMAMQPPLQAFPQQRPTQDGRPFGAPIWQQQPSGQPQYGPWGGM